MAEADESLLSVEIASLRSGVNAEAVLAVLRRTLDILAAVNRESSDYGSETVEWEIAEASKNSPLLAILRGLPTSKNNGAAAVATADRFIGGVDRLSTTDTRPAYFNAVALRDVSELLNVTPKGISGIKYSRLTKDRRVSTSVSVTRKVTSNARNALIRLELEQPRKTGKYTDYGTLEGRLRDLLGSSDKIVLVDELTGKTTACSFEGEENDRKARELWKCRVAVSGLITYDRATELPLSVRVEEIRPLREMATLPQMDDFSGLNITGGLSSEDYVRGLRDGA
jgi:hypothetical protein